MEDEWENICLDLEESLFGVMKSGMSPEMRDKMNKVESEMNKFLDNIPSIILQKQQQKYMKLSDLNEFDHGVSKIKSQSEIAFVILKEMMNEISAGKLRNFLSTWQLRDNIV